MLPRCLKADFDMSLLPTKTIVHRRLFAFYHSKVLNALMIIVMVSLLLMRYEDAFLFAVIAASGAFLIAAGYTLWIWLKKPARLTISRWLSDMSGYFTIYFLIVSAIKDASVWWGVFAAVAAVATLSISLRKRGDEVFEI